jgi:hypothetical protein
MIVFNQFSYDCFKPNTQTFSCKTISNYENVVMEKKKCYKTNMSVTNELLMNYLLVAKIPT